MATKNGFPSWVKGDSDEAERFLSVVNILFISVPVVMLVIVMLLGWTSGIPAVVNYLLFAGIFVWIAFASSSAIGQVPQNNVGFLYFLGKYILHKNAGGFFATFIFRREYHETGNLQTTFSSLSQERKGAYAQGVTMPDITTASKETADWTGFTEGERKMIESGPNNIQVVLNPSVTFTLKYEDDGFEDYLTNIPGTTAEERRIEMERQLHMRSVAVLNREFKRRTYGQLIFMFTVNETVDIERRKLNLDWIIKDDIEKLIDAVDASNPKDVRWGMDCVEALLNRLGASDEIHKKTNAVQEQILQNRADLSKSVTEKEIRKNEGTAEANYLNQINKKCEELKLDPIELIKINARIEMAKSPNATVLMDTGNGGSTTEAMLAQILAELKKR